MPYERKTHTFSMSFMCWDSSRSLPHYQGHSRACTLCHSHSFAWLGVCQSITSSIILIQLLAQEFTSSIIKCISRGLPSKGLTTSFFKGKGVQGLQDHRQGLHQSSGAPTIIHKPQRAPRACAKVQTLHNHGLQVCKGTSNFIITMGFFVSSKPSSIEPRGSMDIINKELYHQGKEGSTRGFNTTS